MSTPTSRLLRIDASARRDGSHSHRLGDLVESQWQHFYPQGDIVTRDLATTPPSHLTEATINSFYTPPDELSPVLRDASAQSDALIAELRSADTLLIASPMYNYGAPSALKAWIDQVVRVGHTFQYGADGVRGLLSTKMAVVALVSGFPGTLGGPVDFLSGHLEAILRFIGVHQVITLHVDGTSGEGEHLHLAFKNAEDATKTLFLASAAV